MKQRNQLVAILACMATFGIAACSNDSPNTPEPNQPTDKCEYGAQSCKGDVIVVCDVTGEYVTSTDCSTKHMTCQADGAYAKCVEKADQPTPTKCTQGSSKCDDANLNVLTCDDNGEYAVSKHCNAETEVCKLVDGVAQCEAKTQVDPDPNPNPNPDPNPNPEPTPQCEAGQTKCDGTTVVSCNDQFQWESGVDCSTNEGDDKNCIVVDNVAACAAVCTNGYSYCKDGGVYTCNDDGIFVATQTCDDDTQICQDDGAGLASCQTKPPAPIPCPEGMVATCEAGGILQYCDDDGNIAVKTCTDFGESYICRTQNGVGECFEAKCQEGTTRCNTTRYVEKCTGGVFVSTACNKIHNSNNFFCYNVGGVDDCYEYDETKADADGDTIPDVVEGRLFNTDTDGDGTPDYLDLDSDGDTIPDAVEGTADADGDGTPNFRDTDSDGNGILDAIEGPCKIKYGEDGNPLLDENGNKIAVDACRPYIVGGNIVRTIDGIPIADTDGDTVPDFLDLDNDGDTIPDNIEIRGQSLRSHTDPNTFSGECPNRTGVGAKNRIGTPQDPVDCNGDTIPDYMSLDSDGDTLPDSFENDVFKGDVYARYSLDTDKDGVSDAIEGTLPNPSDPSKPGTLPDKLPDSDDDTLPDIISLDSDSDGLPDKIEYQLEINNSICKGLKLRITKDSDGDTYQDAAEYAVAQKSGGQYSPAQMVCNKNVGIKHVYKFYFELPYDEKNPAKKDDTLTFVPKVGKLDVVFNVDTTSSMDDTIGNVKKNINKMIDSIRKNVTDSGFSLAMFDDFPIAACQHSRLSCGSGDDLPLRVLGQISKDENVVNRYVNDPLFTTRNGNDGAESGAEALYQLMTREGVKWRSSTSSSTWTSLSLPVIGTDRWGAAGFRKDTLPVIIHATDIYSHDRYSSYNTSVKNSLAYKDGYIETPHYTEHIVPKFKSTGTRVIGLNVGGANSFDQMTVWSRESNAVVPVCAFRNNQNNWICGENKCCLGSSSNPVVVNGEKNRCILVYTGSHDNVNTYVTQGVDALVKYGTYDVSTKIRGEAIGNGKNTSCFIDKIVATQYVAPPQEPEKSCNPIATPAKIKSGSYNDGFRNFATGTSSATRAGAQLKFRVYASNNNCYKPGTETKVFTAHIDVYNPTTGLLFDTQDVAIVVPGIPEQANN